MIVNRNEEYAKEIDKAWSYYQLCLQEKPVASYPPAEIKDASEPVEAYSGISPHINWEIHSEVLDLLLDDLKVLEPRNDNAIDWIELEYRKAMVLALSLLDLPFYQFYGNSNRRTGK
jgi:hypothetical protein